MIGKENKITVFHYNKDDISQVVYGNVSIYKNVSARVLDIDRASASDVRVRIPMDQEMCVSVGDKVVLREVSPMEEIAFEETLTVYKIKNNLRGTSRVRHYLLHLR